MDQVTQIESPCISICEIDANSGLCKGCLRTREEIALWSRADTALRLVILDSIRGRAAAAGKRPRRRTRRRAHA